MIVRRLRESEDDFMCRAVLEIVQSLADERDRWGESARNPERREPTGITVTTEMRPYVELRADDRSKGVA